MIIHEQALIKAMKAARKAGGFHVALMNETEELVIQADCWAVTMDWGNIPGKLLGYVAEATGKLMQPGEAYLVRNKEVLLELMAAVEAGMERIREAFAGGGERIRPTPLKMGGTWLWQCPQDWSIHLLDPDLAGILGSSEAEPVIRENMIRAEGEISTLTIAEIEPGESSRNLIEHLRTVLMVR